MPGERLRTGDAVAFLLLVQFFYAWAWNTGDLLRPAFRDGLNLTLAEVGSGYSAQVVGALLGAIALAQCEPLIGRRLAFAIVAAGGGAALLAGVAVDGWSSFVVQRFFVGVFGGAVFPLTIGVIVDLFASDRRGRLASLIDGTYFGATALLGIAAGQIGSEHWRSLLWIGGLPPLLFAVLAFRFVPPAPPAPPEIAATGFERLAVARLFTRQLRRRTIALTAMMGANACGYQAFSGWLATYLHDDLLLSDSAAGWVLACQFGGSIAGAFAWGWAVDRYGRRLGGLGLIFAGAAGALFLFAPPHVPLLGLAAACFGVAFAAVVTLGPWIAELYPPGLRAAATSMFQWGRFISLFAPLITAPLAARWGLGNAMLLGVAAFLVAGAIWSRLPETLSARTD